MHEQRSAWLRALGRAGALAIVRAREKAEKTLGAKFNIRAFHDAVFEKLKAVHKNLFEKAGAMFAH
jgi:hypothetical protein